MHRSGIMTLASAGAALLLLVSVPVEGAKPASKGGGGGGGGTTCSPMAVTVEIYDTDTSDNPYALRSDGGGIYTDGSAGVSAVIHNCPNGSGDMTLGFSGHKNSRSITIDLSGVIVSSSITPSWGTDVLSIGGMAIGNIWNYHDAAQDGQTFTTGIGASGFPNVNYYFRMTNLLANIVPTWTYHVSFPCDNALVNVKYHAASSDGSVKQYWEVWPDAAPTTSCNTNPGTTSTPSQVGSLIDSRVPEVVSQYTIPFYIVVREK